MILAIIISVLVFIGFIVCGRFVYAEYKNGESKIPKIKDSCLSELAHWAKSFVFGMASFLVVFFALVLVTDSLISSGKVETKLVEVSSTEIYALQDNQFVNKRYTANNSYYLTLEEVEGKGKQIKEYRTSNSYIDYIPSNEQPYIKEVKTELKNDYWYLIPTKSKSEYIFYIPEGSVIEEYNIDLQ